MPTSLHSAVRDREGRIAFIPDAGPLIDSEPWRPELSPDGFVGLFFRWNEGLVHESRLCLYVVCQSYLPKACIELTDMVHQLEDACSVGCVSLSEEVQWLRNACARNRARLIAEICAEMDLRIPVVQDYCAKPEMEEGGRREALMALVTTETLHHDLRFVASHAAPSANAGTTRLLNYCAESKNAFNGSVCAMAPWSGLWIFRGAAAMEDGGESFGHLQVC